MADTVTRFDPGDPWPADLAELEREAPHAHFAIREGERSIAGCSVWLGEAQLPGDGRTPGVIGHFSGADPLSARRVLESAMAALRQLGRTVVVGPMNGNTWRRYRFTIEGTERPPFFLEPTNPPEYPQYFADAGFSVLATYHSTIFHLAAKPDDRTPQAMRKFAEAGIVIRPLDLSRLDDDLSAIHALSLESFADNFLYSPLSREAFVEQYRKLGPLLRPVFALLAERNGELLGFVFAILDALEQPDSSTKTLIVKTVAVRAECRATGLGSTLIDLVRRRAADSGFTHAIHALIHDDNISRHIGAGEAMLLRRYALYARELA